MRKRRERDGSGKMDATDKTGGFPGDRGKVSY